LRPVTLPKTASGGCFTAAGRCAPTRFAEHAHRHATVSITLDTYSHAIPAMQEEAAALIAGLVLAEG